MSTPTAHSAIAQPRHGRQRVVCGMGAPWCTHGKDQGRDIASACHCLSALLLTPMRTPHT